MDYDEFDDEPSPNKGKWWGDAGWEPIKNPFPEQLCGPVCTACHGQIRDGDRLFSLHIGTERREMPMYAYLRFTGMFWHLRCMNIRSLPGMQFRDDDLEKEFFRSRSKSAG